MKAKKIVTPDGQPPISVGTQLRYFRGKLWLKQREMAQILGISFSLYSKLESGHTTIPERTVARLASILNTSVEFLTTGQGDESLPPPRPTREQRTISSFSDEDLLNIINLALRDDLQRLAREVAANMSTTPRHAMAIIIRSILQGDKEYRAPRPRRVRKSTKPSDQ